MQPTPESKPEIAATVTKPMEEIVGFPHPGYNQLFTVEEAFVRLGQSLQTGELMVLNQDETFHLFVEKGYVVYAAGDKETGEPALLRALDLPSSNFVWIAAAQPVLKDLHLLIREYVLRHSMARDLNIAHKIDAQKRETLALPRDTASVHPEFEIPKMVEGYYFVPESNPGYNMPLNKVVSLVGREIYCDWVIEDTRVSRKHSVLQTTADGVWVRDLESANGTFINGRRTTEECMHVGDKLSLGGYVMVLYQEPEKVEPGISPAGADLVLKVLSSTMV
jgi:hypothetical protein